MDTVFIRQLSVATVIGCYDWERTIKQTVVLDLDMHWDIRAASAGDDLQYALDYAKVSERLISFIEGSEFQLIETMAEQCCAIVLAEFNVPWLRLSLNKPGAVSAANTVGLVIERGEKFSEGGG
ncbi:MAG: dihydroneopterin aldolase [Pseudomonadales bacterium]|nr:dihydroneopterin aldolase [Pseudomonadales bacterium]